MPKKKDVEGQDVSAADAPQPDRIDEATGERIGIMKASDHPAPADNPQVVIAGSGNAEELDKAVDDAMASGSHDEQVARVKALVAGLRSNLAGAPGIHIPVPPDPGVDRNPETGNPYH